MLKLPGFSGKFGQAAPAVAGAAEPVKPSAAASTAGRPQTRPDASFKIKDSLRQLDRQQPAGKTQAVVEKQLPVEEREPVSEEKMKAALKQYIREHHLETTVKMALTTHSPELCGEQIILSVDNQLQLEKLEAMKLQLQQALMKSLRNGRIVCQFKLFEEGTAKEEKKLFTVSEKFEHFVKLNPVIADLKQMFGLELE